MFLFFATEKNNMNWIYVVIGGIFEVVFTLCLGKIRETNGTAAYWWIACFIISLFVSMALVIKATQTLPIGTAYAVWTGIGAVGTVLMGIIVFNEPASFLRLLFIATLIGSIIGLKVVSH